MPSWELDYCEDDEPDPYEGYGPEDVEPGDDERPGWSPPDTMKHYRETGDEADLPF